MGPSKELRRPLRYYHKSGPTTKTWGPLMSLTSKALPEEQRLPPMMMKIELKTSLLQSKMASRWKRLTQNFEQFQNLRIRSLN